MAMHNAQHDQFFFGRLKNNYAFLICKTSKALPEFIASDARKAPLCKSSDLRFQLENETVGCDQVFKSNVNMVVKKVFTGTGRPERFARFNCPSPSLYCVLRPYA